jgi:hypothetical protein
MDAVYILILVGLYLSHARFSLPCARLGEKR